MLVKLFAGSAKVTASDQGVSLLGGDGRVKEREP